MLLMTDGYAIRRPTSVITQQLLDVFKDAGGEWLSRGQIARLLGKKRLNPAELAALETLIKEGRIEAVEKATNAPSGVVWMYRSVE
jgi:hypothetical protein